MCRNCAGVGLAPRRLRRQAPIGARYLRARQETVHVTCAGRRRRQGDAVGGVRVRAAAQQLRPGPSGLPGPAHGCGSRRGGGAQAGGRRQSPEVAESGRREAAEVEASGERSGSEQIKSEVMIGHLSAAWRRTRRSLCRNHCMRCRLFSGCVVSNSI